MHDDNTDLDHIPGVDGWPVLGHTLWYLRDPLGMTETLREKYGPLHRSRVLFRTTLSACTPELATEVLLDREQVLSSKNGWGHTIGELFPRGLMLRDFEDHRRHRRIMQGAFTTTALRGYHAGVEAMTARTVADWVERGSLDAYPALKTALLEQAATVFLGLAVGDEARALSDAFVAMLDASLAVVRRRIPGTTWDRGLRGRERLEAFFRAELPARRSGEGTDLFSLLCQASDEDGDQFTDDEIVDHMIFLLLAAHDTTTSAAATLVEQLACAPDWQDRLRAECLAVAPEAEHLPFDALGELQQVELALKEALRLRPPVRYIVRRTTRETELGGNALPARCPVALHVDQVHRDPSVWTAPETFDPDRFTAPRSEHKGHKHAWVPFGGGAHTCIGMKFAILQTRTLVWHLLRRARVETVSGGPSPWQEVPIPKPADGLPVRLSPLEEQGI